MERYLTSEDLIEAQLVVSRRTLDNWASKGIGPKFVKVGRHRRYRQSDVEAWLASRERGPVGFDPKPAA